MPTETVDIPTDARTMCPCGLRLVEVFPSGRPGRLCKACHQAERRARLPAENAAASLAWRRSHPGAQAASNHSWYVRNRERLAGSRRLARFVTWAAAALAGHEGAY